VVQPAKCTRAAAELDEEEHVQPLQPDRLDGEEVDRDHAVCLGSQESRQESPARSPARSRPASRSSFRTVVADTATPSPRSSPTIRWIAPLWVLAREAQHELADLAPDRRAADSTGVRPALHD